MGNTVIAAAAANGVDVEDVAAQFASKCAVDVEVGVETGTDRTA